ncbi:hypothetical protein ACQKWADRAFT_295471, partial [Trichoderma austrokoningii]
MASKPPEEDPDDAVSITSTDDGIPDEDLFVTKILADRVVNGEAVYLIEWQDYSLAEATWEPRENLSDALMAEWEQTKADQGKGLAPRFKIQEWKTANIQHYKSRLARHHLRNSARERRGLPQTTWTRTLDHLLKDLADFANEEDDENDQAKATPTTQSPPPNAVSDDVSTPMHQSMNNRASEPSAQMTIKPFKKISPEKCIGAFDGGAGPGAGRRALSPVEKLSHKRLTSEDADITTQKLDQDPIKRSKFSCQFPKKPPLLSRVSAGGPTKSAGYANVFAGGRTRKGRGTLSEAASNPEKNPKFLNLRRIRQLELQRRNKEGLKPPAQQPSALISLDPHSIQPMIVGQQEATASRGSTSPKKNGVDRWDDEAMEVDSTDSLFVSDDLPQTPQTTSNEEDEELGDDAEQSSNPTTTISKTVQLGPDRQDTITLSFAGMPPRGSSPWVTKFGSVDSLIFTHNCTAQDFLEEINKGADFSGAQLCKGTAFSYTEMNKIRILADNLRLADIGSLCSNESFHVFLLPRDQSARDSREIPLEYTIFEASSSLGSSMLAPTPKLSMSNKHVRSSASYPRPLDHVFGVNFEQLLPPNARNAEKCNFFLAFPLRAKQEAAMLSWWMMSHDSNSDIRTSFDAGHWASFSKLPHGTVIIHEDSLWMIRLFPELHVLLHGPRASFSFWMLGRSLVPTRSFGSDDLPVPPLGDIHLERIFDTGVAYLITPSFLLSEPERAYTFLKWFWRFYVCKTDMSRPRKLVLCAKVDEWMHNLIYEKLLTRRTLPATASEEELKAAGVSDKEFACRDKTFKLVQQLLFDAAYERTNCIVVAPDSIDGNDEQSLVNWFGYWSTLNIDQFRRYTVIGSSRQTKGRLSRILRAPNYSKSVIADPDGVESDLAKSSDPVLATSPATQRLNRDDEFAKLSHDLAGIEDFRGREWSPVKLFWFPVGYSTSDVSFRLGDIDPKYKNCDEWFSFFWNHRKAMCRAKRPRNSYIGFFYTLDEGQALSRGVHNVKRSPWVVIFRPVDPHSRPWQRSEIFIWDTRYSDMIRKNKRLCYSDLSEVQQHLIEHIRAKTKDDLPLEKVWVGSFGAAADCTDALGVTLRWLDGLPGKVRDWLPAPSRELPRKGWSLVTPEKPLENQMSGGVIVIKDDILKGLSLQDDACSTPKIIFHPPDDNNEKPYSKCRNRLYQCAREADPKFEGKNFEYTFRPTMDWYAEQCEEGRGLDHIRVLPWQDIFQMHRI